SRPRHHPSHPRRAPAARSDGRQAAGAFSSPTRLARAAHRARLYVSPIRLIAQPTSSRPEATRLLRTECRHTPPTASAALRGTGIRPDRDIGVLWRDIARSCASPPTAPPTERRTPARKARFSTCIGLVCVRHGLSAGEEWIRTCGSAILIMLRKTG